MITVGLFFILLEAYFLSYLILFSLESSHPCPFIDDERHLIFWFIYLSDDDLQRRYHFTNVMLNNDTFNRLCH